MTRPGKPDLARGWLYAEKLVDKEADRLATMSDEDFEREMDALPEGDVAAMAEAPAAPTGGGSGSSSKHVAEVVPMRGGGRKARTAIRWIALLAAAAVCVLVVHVVTSPPPATVGTGNPRLRAETLRGQALAACEKASWAACERDLDEARAIDPAGDADPRVQATRAAALAALGADGAVGKGD
jgi:hypothetical protein